MDVTFHTFGDGAISFRLASNRLARQAIKSGEFKTVISWNLSKLVSASPSFQSHLEWILENPRGLGLWIWKPYVLLESLNRSAEGDVVVVLDSGCHLNLNDYSKLRLREYFKMTIQAGGVFMQLVDGEFEIEDLTDEAWTKLETLDFLDESGILRKTNQIQSGIIFLKNDDAGRAFAQEWLERCTQNNYQLLRNPKFGCNQESKFREHRWEQSILSLIVKAKTFILLSDETYFAPNWSNGTTFPIWATRNRSGGNPVRRNIFDLLLIGGARIELYILRKLPLYRKLLIRTMGLTKNGNLSSK